MVVQRYGIFDKWMFSFAISYDFDYMNKYDSFIKLIEYIIYYYRLNINVDDFLNLAKWEIYLGEYRVIAYPVEFVNVENITLWKYLTKEEGYYDFKVEVTDENRLKFKNYKHDHFSSVIYYDDII